MTRGQRRIIIFGLPVLAFLLHTLLCEWTWKGRMIEWQPQYAFWSFTHDPPAVGELPEVTGLFPAAGVSHPVSAIGGVVVPLLIIATDAWLMLGWRRKDLIKGKICPHCRHDLHGADHEKCPECGADVERLKE